MYLQYKVAVLGRVQNCSFKWQQHAVSPELSLHAEEKTKYTSTRFVEIAPSIRKRMQ